MSRDGGESREGAGPARPGWGTIGLAAVLVWATPCLLGILVLGLAFGISHATGTLELEMDRHPLLALFMAGYVLFFSPLLSWIGICLAILPAGWLIRRGRAGWRSFLLLGLLAGTLAGSMVPGFGTAIAAAYGALAALGFLWAVRRLQPRAAKAPERP